MGSGCHFNCNSWTVPLWWCRTEALVRVLTPFSSERGMSNLPSAWLRPPALISDGSFTLRSISRGKGSAMDRVLQQLLPSLCLDCLLPFLTPVLFCCGLHRCHAQQWNSWYPTIKRIISSQMVSLLMAAYWFFRCWWHAEDWQHLGNWWAAACALKSGLRKGSFIWGLICNSLSEVLRYSTWA